MAYETDLIILGHGATHSQCTFHCETWGVNSGYKYFGPVDSSGRSRLDKCFIVDRITTREFDFDLMRKVADCGMQFVTSVPYPDHPEWRAITYPIKEIVAHFQSKFFSNAICYMLAYAVWLHETGQRQTERIYLFGIDHMTSTSYVFEKGGCEYWMGITHARGIQIINTPDSCTGKTIDGKMYGYWGADMDNHQSYSKAVAEESMRFVKNVSVGLKGLKAEKDPFGDLDVKNELLRQQLGVK
jgi:hypothetical protein